ncbi:fibronectin type III domain-containing protein [Zunongwangia atlantica]|uniref:Fibronectin type-III domain-containing protein n=1 Tax=Zunongwangia atlantica 22II14-10F7 TaxID=1185767 RepID=A0A1Y1SZK2_9FLAO|nr:hypothetical protein [Zunongwangia atlantica]ORL44177.1 hypothetical protein IIF7_16857 [Zunongwangia atlantica 22II14-10F7]
MRNIITLVFILCLFSCSPSDSSESEIPAENKPPNAPQLVYPADNSLCVDSEIQFEWSNVDDPDLDEVSYRIEISENRSFTNIIESMNTENNNLAVTLSEGTAYYWRVNSIDENDNESDFSKVFAFYVEGEAMSNYIPFKAERISPLNNEELTSSSFTLKWEATDLDNDDLKFDLYFGISENPPLIAENLDSTEFEVSLESNTRYYWQVNSKDATSKSIGDIWVFFTK